MESNTALEMPEFYGKVLLSSWYKCIAFFSEQQMVPVLLSVSNHLSLGRKKQTNIELLGEAQVAYFQEILFIVTIIMYVSAVFFRCSCVMVLERPVT